VALLACLCLAAQAGEPEIRQAIKAEAAAAFARGDYEAIEKRYAAALAKSERTPSGVSVANQLLIGLVPEPSGKSDVPGRDDHWLPVERKLDDWAARFPQSTLVAIAQAQAYIAHGWSWRGGGYARTVTPENFKKVQEYGKRAYDALMAREKVGRTDPNWYVQMITVARVLGWEREPSIALYQAAMKAFPLNYDIYFHVASRLTPRWGGSPEAVASLASFAVDQTRKVEGESMYARIYWSVGSQLDAELSSPDVDWKRIRAGFEDVIKRYPDPYNLNHYARMACEARDQPTTRRVLLRIKGDVEQSAWVGRAHYLRCVEAAGLKREELQ
jgi:hypothetical protein